MRKRLSKNYIWCRMLGQKQTSGNGYMKDLEENSEIRNRKGGQSGPEFLSEVPRGKEFQGLESSMSRTEGPIRKAKLPKT